MILTDQTGLRRLWDVSLGVVRQELRDEQTAPGSELAPARAVTVPPGIRRAGAAPAGAPTPPPAAVPVFRQPEPVPEQRATGRRAQQPQHVSLLAALVLRMTKVEEALGRLESTQPGAREERGGQSVETREQDGSKLHDLRWRIGELERMLARQGAAIPEQEQVGQSGSSPTNGNAWMDDDGGLGPHTFTARLIGPLKVKYDDGKCYLGGIEKLGGGTTITIVPTGATHYIWVKVNYGTATAEWGNGAVVPSNTESIEYYVISELILNAAYTQIVLVKDHWCGDIRERPI